MRVLLVAGIAAAGKNSVIDELVKTKRYYFFISHTTRPPRVLVDGGREPASRYHYVNLDTMRQMIKRREFVEVKIVRHRYIYGTSIEELSKVRQSGLVGVTDLDVQGVAEYMRLGDRVNAVFLLPPDYETWLKRLLRRNRMDQDELKQQLRLAEAELETAISSGYYSFVVNDNLRQTVKAVDLTTKEETSTNKDSQLDLAWQLLSQFKRELAS